MYFVHTVHTVCISIPFCCVLLKAVITGAPPRMVPNVTVRITKVDGNNITLTVEWEEALDNFDPIVNYTVSCSGNDRCPQSFTTTDNTTRSHTITNLTTMTSYTFSVVATNSFGSGEAGKAMITIPGEVNML